MQFHRRVRQREDGFALVEVVVAILVIFAALSGLIYTATKGFSYDAYARERQTATGLAQSRLEQLRGIAYADVANNDPSRPGGLKTSDLAGDSNIILCSGIYRFKSCTAGANGIGDPIVNSSLANNSVLVPHRVTNVVSNNVTYTWAEYVTNPSPATSPYTVTVIVTWASAALASYGNNLVQVQSQFFAPTGSSSVCQSSSTHPYPAPCSAFFYGQALVPRGSITISGTVSQLTTFQSASLFTGSVESDGQVEQVGEVQGNFTRSGVALTLSDGTTTKAGGTSATTTAADTDPGGTVSAYSNVGPSTVAGGPLFVGASCTGTPSLCVTAPSDSAQSQSAAAASAASACPPPSVAGAETDGQPCGGSTVQQGGSLTAVLNLSGISGLPNLGAINLVQIAAASSLPQTSFANRQLGSGDGYQQQTVQRRFGIINIGGLPATAVPFAHPSGWDNQCNGYLLTFSNYRDSASATVGTSAAAPTAAVNTTSPAPQFSYWNGSSCTQNVAATSNVPAINASFPQAYFTPNRTVTVTMTTTGLAAPVGTTSSTPSGSGSLTRTAASAQLTSPIKGTINYVVTVTQNSTTTVANLTIQIDLGTTSANGTYQPAPTAG